jgi:uncharacterized LabA/DUF88 family protein
LSKNVAVFVDVANIFYAAKAAGVDIDYVTLLKASSAGRDLVRAYAYTGLDPENENQRNFHDFLRRHGYKVVSKDIRKYGDGKVKANLDIELVVDMMKTARNLDIAIVVSGDGDFAPAIRAVQEMGVRVEVVSFRGNTSSDLIDVADTFTDITQIAKVEKGSSRSGRRVATDEEDLSMTEVPDKMTEGTGDGRRRRGSRARTSETAAAATATGTRRGAATAGRAGRSRAAAEAAVVAGALVTLPGEKLSRARRPAAEAEAVTEPTGEPIPDGEELEPDEIAAGAEGAPDEAQLEEGRRRRRRRRGGRGRGRGRTHEDVGLAEGEAAVGEAEEDRDLEPLPAQPPRRAAFSFGSVWDSQLGKSPAAPPPGVAAAAGSLGEQDEDLEEPAIPEYLLAERRQREAGRGQARRAGRGRNSAYAAALERERFGGGRGSASVSRFAEPSQRGRDLGGRSSRPVGRPFERPEPRATSSEPWSEVPPEIEAMLRAQLAAGGGQPSRPAPRPPVERSAPEAEAAAAVSPAPARARRGAPTRPRRTSSAADHPGTAATVEAAAAPPQEQATSATRRRRATSKGSAASEPAAGIEAAPKAPRRRAASPPAAADATTAPASPVGPTDGPADAASATDAPADVAGATVPPRRRASRKKTATAD